MRRKMTRRIAMHGAPYDAQWRNGFADFAAAAARQNIDVMAGIAPGLDFNFAELEKTRDGDFACLVKKLNN